jgi:hypothetical protein
MELFRVPVASLFNQLLQHVPYTEFPALPEWLGLAAINGVLFTHSVLLVANLDTIRSGRFSSD